MAPVPTASFDSTPFVDSLQRPLIMLAVIPFVYVGYRICRTIAALVKAIFIYVISAVVLQAQPCPIRESMDSGDWRNRWHWKSVYDRVGKERIEQICAHRTKSDKTERYENTSREHVCDSRKSASYPVHVNSPKM
ncbi:hypothetical protein OSTOST_11877 [Ostertagia ostertagi]